MKNYFANADVDPYVKLIRNEKEIMVPLEDYLDRESYRYGFDSYDELRAAGYSIDIPTLYTKDGSCILHNIENIESNETEKDTQI